MDAASWAPRNAAMRNVLEAFAVVHVHVNNGCPDGTCIEVTFANRDFFRADWCAWPRRHSLDQPNSATRPDQDVAGLFPWIANLPEPLKIAFSDASAADDRYGGPPTSPLPPPRGFDQRGCSSMRGRRATSSISSEAGRSSWSFTTRCWS
mmetsp:Transcript_62867/g.180247  ORF Transcript_62867/g.180247 Transcript_62867/m.180247 type:complete len:150 (+) Transcript_62867:442-891(+)